MLLSIEASLRQFARAVTADQLAGDELVRTCLSEMNRLGVTGFSTRVEAYRLFMECWRAAASSEDQPALFSDALLLQSMGPPPSEARLVLLLSDIVGLSSHEVEEVLGGLSRPYRELLDEGRKLTRKVEAARALIIEDEPLIAADLRDLLEQMGIEVVGAARTADAGAAIAAKTPPDILLADYNLDGDKTGVDAVLTIQEDHACPVVFITGYPDKVLSGEHVEPDFVIVKPYRPEAVRAAVAHCLDTTRYAVTE